MAISESPELGLREAARRAYHAADNNDVLRRAMLRRSCPSRGSFHQGEWVMIWRSSPLKQTRWYGPLRVILQDGQHRVWCTTGGTIFRSAPENTRKAYPEEGEPHGRELPSDTIQLEAQVQPMQSSTTNNPSGKVPNDNPQETKNPLSNR